MTYNTLEKCRDNLFRCLKCGTCHSSCPTYLETHDEATAPRGRLALIQALLDGRLNPSKRLKELLSTCTGCLACSERCPNNVDVVRIITAARNEIVNKSWLTPLIQNFAILLLRRGWALRSVAKMINHFTRIYNLVPVNGVLGGLLPYTTGGIKRCLPKSGETHLRSEFPEIVKVKNPIAKVAYFTGCITDLMCQDSGRAVISLLKENHIEVWIPKDQLCCGAPMYYSGGSAGSMELALKNIDVLKSQNVDAIITSCATCGHVLKNIYPELTKSSDSYDLARDISEKVTDVHKFIVDKLMGKSLIQPKRSLKKRIKVTYHDPCHLRRGMKIFKEPRELLKSLPDLEYIEMDDSDRCCGGSGLFSIKHYDLSTCVGKHKADSVRKTNANIIVTGCPSCQIQLEDMLNREGLDVEVVHTIQLLRRFQNAC